MSAGDNTREGIALMIATTVIFALQDGVEKAVAYMTTTMMAVPDPKLNL